MKCCVGTCSRAATQRVRFAVTGKIYCYCNWHCFERNGVLRWGVGVAEVEKI